MVEVLVLVFVVLLVAVVAVIVVQLSVECSTGMLVLFLSERRTTRRDSNEFLLRAVVVVVIAVGRKEAVREGDKQASGEGTLFSLEGRALLEHNKNDRGSGEWRNGGKRGREGE